MGTKSVKQLIVARDESNKFGAFITLNLMHPMLLAHGLCSRAALEKANTDNYEELLDSSATETSTRIGIVLTEIKSR